MGVERRHTLAATLILAVFVGLLGYSYRAELLPWGLRLLQPLLSLTAETTRSAHFEVRNRSSAGVRQVERMVETLEKGYTDISQFLGRSRTTPIVVDLADGSAPAFSDGENLHVFYDQGYINLDLAYFWLVGLMVDKPTRPFLDAGLAIYTLEEIGYPLLQFTQPADAWVTLLMEKQAVLPLSEAWELTYSTDQDLAFLFRAALEAGSFVRWVVETQGWDTYWELRRGGDVEGVLRQPLAQVEAAWLERVATSRLIPKPCLLATPTNNMFRQLCRQLDEVTQR